MRVTFSALNNGLDAINTAADQFVEAQWQVSTGKRLHHLSTDPAATQQSVVERGERANIDSYDRAGSSASARLSTLDDTLGDIVDQITRAKVAAASARTDTATPTTRAAAAIALSGVRDSIANDINTQSNGQYLFGGSNNVQPYVNAAPGGWAYGGNQDQVSVEVERGRRVTLTMDGEKILKDTDSADVLTVIDSLAAAVIAGNTAGIDTGMAALDRAFQRVTRAQSQVGSDEVTVAESSDRLSSQRLASDQRLNDVENVDMAAAITRMTRAQTAYNAALGAVGTAGRNSLMDYVI